MVRRIRLTFWRVLDRVHVRLHEMMDRRNLDFYTYKNDPDNWDFTVPSYPSTVTYDGRDAGYTGAADPV